LLQGAFVGAVLRILLESDADITRARRLGRALAVTLPFTTSELRAITTAIAELGRNILAFASRGEIRITLLARDGRTGLEIVADDTGPGMYDPALALVDGFSTSGRSGTGLAGLRRMMDSFEMTSQVGVGTRISMQKWAR
jgi:serine/threonine-protein kinase RsbT